MAYVEHFGVKGMHWGVRKDAGHEGETASTKKIAKLDQKFEKNTMSMHTLISIHNRAADFCNDHDIDRINNKPEYKNLDLSDESKAGLALSSKYIDEQQMAYTKNLEKAAAEVGTNASGTKKYVVSTNSDGSWSVSTKDVVHAGDVSFTVHPVYDAKGRLVKIKPGITDHLAHFGVKGMHWGVRKEAATGLHPDYTPRMQKSDENFGGKASVARVNQHMLNGKTHAQAANLESDRALKRNLAVAGVAATAYVLAKHGGTALKLITAAAEASRTQDLVKNALEVSRDITNPKQNRQGVYNITTL